MGLSSNASDVVFYGSVFVLPRGFLCNGASMSSIA
jgi:hypothetical protein